MRNTPVTAHELARAPLSGPDLPVTTYANGHNTIPDTLKVGVLSRDDRPRWIVIGNFGYRGALANYGQITEMLLGDAPRLLFDEEYIRREREAFWQGKAAR